MYEIRFTGAAEKYFKKVKEKGLKKAFRAALEEIGSDPYIGEMKTCDLAGVYCYDVHYSKTNYEIAYRIYEEDGKIVVVILAGTRENFYDEFVLGFPDTNYQSEKKRAIFRQARVGGRRFVLQCDYCWVKDLTGRCQGLTLSKCPGNGEPVDFASALF